jgi:hypothetical protein
VARLTVSDSVSQAKRTMQLLVAASELLATAEIGATVYPLFPFRTMRRFPAESEVGREGFDICRCLFLGVVRVVERDVALAPMNTGSYVCRVVLAPDGSVNLTGAYILDSTSGIPCCREKRVGLYYLRRESQ